MDPINGPINDMFDFDAFDNNEQDVSLVADKHLFEDGTDLFGLNPPNLGDEFMAFPLSDNLNGPFAHGTSLGSVTLPTSDREFFDDNLELFANVDFSTGLTNFAPLDEPAPQFAAQQFDGGLGLTFDATLPMGPELPPLTIEPAVLLKEPQSSFQIVLATLEEQQQWQAFKNQQTQFFQPEPEAVQAQQMQAVQQWANIEDQPGLPLQSPFESPVDESISLDFQAFPDSEVTQDPQQAPDLLQQDILSDEQIHFLQNVEPAEYVQPSIEVSPTNTTFSRDKTNSEITPRSRNTRIGRRNPSSRTATPERVTQHELLPQAPFAGLTFVSLEDAEAAMPSRYIENAWEPPSPDNTIPNTQKKRAKYVLAMFEAFQDISECKDNTKGFSYVKRWKDGGYYDLRSMEKVCWHMLDIAERLHANGPSSTVMYCEEALKKLRGSRTLTFEQRIHAVCAMLRFSKYLCDQLMKGEGLEALVGAPKQKMSGATTMQVQNKKRQKWIVHGRTEDPLHPNPEENEGDEQDDIGVTESAQRKTKPKAKRATPAKPRTKTKACSTKISGDESDDDDESRHRRQSNHSIAQVEDESDMEMADEPQQFITPEPSPSPVVRTPSPSSPAPSSSPRKPSPSHRMSVLPSTPSPVASPVTSPVSTVSPTSPPALSPTAADFSDLSSAPASPVSLEPASKLVLPKRLPSRQVRIPRTEVDTGRARFQKQQKSDKLRKERDARLAATRAAANARVIVAEAAEEERKTKREASEAKKAATKMKTKTGSRKRPIDLTETDSEDDEPATRAKRQRKSYEELFNEWLARNDGSNADDHQDVGEDDESEQHSDEAESDNDHDTRYCCTGFWSDSACHSACGC